MFPLNIKNLTFFKAFRDTVWKHSLRPTESTQTANHPFTLVLKLPHFLTHSLHIWDNFRSQLIYKTAHLWDVGGSAYTKPTWSEEVRANPTQTALQLRIKPRSLELWDSSFTRCANNMLIWYCNPPTLFWTNLFSLDDQLSQICMQQECCWSSATFNI